MHKPQLRRSILQQQYLQPQKLSTSPMAQLQSMKEATKQLTLVPQAFFQQCKSILANQNREGLNGIINTCDYIYPKVVDQQITAEGQGFIQYVEGIFCFYKQKTIYFWQYDKNDFNRPLKILKETFSSFITAVNFKHITFPQFGEPLQFVIIAFGSRVRFFKLKDFQIEKRSIIPQLIDMGFTLYSPQVVTTLSIIFQENPDGDIQKNKLSIIFGDANGNLIFFDFVTKKKYIVDSIKQNMKRKITKQSYSEIKQILVFNQFVFCLVNRYYENNTIWKLLHKIFRSPKATIQVEQKIQVYRMEIAPMIRNKYWRNLPNTNLNVTEFKKYNEFSTQQIIEKMKGSFSKYFEQQSKINNQNFGLIDSLTIKNNYVLLMFQSGQSVLIDQDFSFAQKPKSCVSKPQNFGLINRNNINGVDLLYEKQTLIKSFGTKLMLFQGFLASIYTQSSYFTPYNLKNNSQKIRSIKQYFCHQNSFTSTCNQYIIFNRKYFTVAQLITPPLSLFLLCSAITQQYPYQQYIVQRKKYNQIISQFVNEYGSVTTIVALLQIFLKINSMESMRINLRVDIFELIIRQLSVDKKCTFKQAIKVYEEGRNNLTTWTQIKFNKEINLQIWKIILKYDKQPVKLNKYTGWNVANIQAICLSLQVIISEIFKYIKDWNARKFCKKRNQVYRIITNGHILSQLIQNYINVEAEQNSNMLQNNQLNNMITNQSAQQFNFIRKANEIKSLKIKFCFLAKETVDKIILLLKAYDFVCQMDFHGTFIPKLSDLLFNMNKLQRLNFSNTILKTLGLNNQILMSELIAKIPELQINQIRKYYLWKSLHQKPEIKFQQLNQTQVSQWDEQAEEISGIINQANYIQILNFYLNGFQPINNTGFIQNFDIEKAKTNQFIYGVVILLKSTLKKLANIKQQQVQLANILTAYKKSPENYFGLLEISALERKLDQLKNEDKFFIKNICEPLIDQLFNKYQKGMVMKPGIMYILEHIRSGLTVEVRRKLQKYLDKYKLTDLTQGMLSRLSLFNVGPVKPQPNMLNNNFLINQLSIDMFKTIYGR